MSNRKIEMYEYKQIIYRLKSGQAIREIARSGLASRTKVGEILEVANARGWLNPDTSLPDDDAITATFAVKKLARKNSNVPKAKPYKDLIDPWIDQGIQGTVIFRYLVDNHQFDGAYNCIQRYIKRYKNKMSPDLTVPLNFKPAEAAQVDFGQGPKLLDLRTGKIVKTWFFVMTLCFSRHQYAQLVTNQEVQTWLSCHKNAFEWFGGVVSKVIIDNPKCAITKASTTDPQVQRSYEAFAQECGFVISACPPADPQKKGRVESGVKYVKKNFVPLKDFSSLQDADKQLKGWILEIAGNRTHGTTRKRPLDCFTEFEKSFLKELPTDPIDISIWKKVKLYRDCHIRIDYCRYSAPYQYAEQDLWAKVSETTVSIYLDHQLLTTHAKTFDSDRPRTKLDHLPPNAKAFFEQDALWCEQQAKSIGIYCQEVVETLLTDPVRDLLRGAQAIIRLSKTYNKQRLEKACHRALLFNTVNAPTIKTILQKGLDYEALPIEKSFDQLGQAYQGHAAYQRSTNNFQH